MTPTSVKSSRSSPPPPKLPLLSTWWTIHLSQIFCCLSRSVLLMIGLCCLLCSLIDVCAAGTPLTNTAIIDPESSSEIRPISFINAHHYPEHRLHRIQRQLHQKLQQQPKSDPLEASESTLILNQTDNGDPGNGESDNGEEETLPVVTEVETVTTLPPSTTLVDQPTTTTVKGQKEEFEPIPVMNGARIVRRRRMKVRRSNEFDVLTPTDLAMLRLNNKRKLLKKVIKLRKKNNNEGKIRQSLAEEAVSTINDNVGEYGGQTETAYPTTLTTPAPEQSPSPVFSPKREKIICLSMAKSNDTDLTSPKCFYALDEEQNGNGNNDAGAILPVTEQPNNSISSNNESDLLHTEESSSSRLFRHYMPPLLVPPTTTRSFFKRIGLFGGGSNSGSSLNSGDNQPTVANKDDSTTSTTTTTTTTSTTTTTTTTESPPSITFGRQAIAYNFAENRGEENSIDSASLDQTTNVVNSNGDESSSSSEPFVNVYEYPQEPIALVEQQETKANHNNGTSTHKNAEKSLEYYQLVDGDVDIVSLVPPSGTTTSGVAGIPNDEQVDAVVVLPDSRDPTLTMIREVEEYSTTPSPSITTMDDESIGQNGAKNQTQEDFSSSVKDLWQVNRRKAKTNRAPTIEEDSNTNNNTMATTTTSLIFDRYASQQQQQTSNKRPLRIPKLLLPKVNRPAMYSLNGYVPKPSLQRHHSQMSPQSTTTLDPSKKSKIRRTRTRNNGGNKQGRKSGKKSRRRNSGPTNSHSSHSVYPWDRSKLSGNKMTGKNEDDHFDEDDLEDDDDDDSYDDMIETSETISHRRSDSANSLVPSAHSSSSTSASMDQKRKSLSRTLKKNGGTLAPKASLSTIPKTSFECGDKRPDGVYADEETGCQVWHICQNGQMHSFLCPIGTIFNSKNGVCDWWYNSAC